MVAFKKERLTYCSLPLLLPKILTKFKLCIALYFFSTAVFLPATWPSV